jgi:hypothetical protein
VTRPLVIANLATGFELGNMLDANDLQQVAGAILPESLIV